MTTRSGCCAKPWRECHCGDWRVLTAFGHDLGTNPTWEHHQGIARPKATPDRTRSNGPVITRRMTAADRIGRRVA